MHILLQVILQTPVPCFKEIKQFVTGFYTHAASQCSGLDVRILLSNISNAKDLLSGPQTLHRDYECVLSDCISSESETTLVDYMQQNFPRKDSTKEVLFKPVGNEETSDSKKPRLDESGTGQK